VSVDFRRSRFKPVTNNAIRTNNSVQYESRFRLSPRFLPFLAAAALLNFRQHKVQGDYAALRSSFTSPTLHATEGSPSVDFRSEEEPSRLSSARSNSSVSLRGFLDRFLGRLSAAISRQFLEGSACFTIGANRLGGGLYLKVSPSGNDECQEAVIGA
jgi:hypothetical protein